MIGKKKKKINQINLFRKDLWKFPMAGISQNENEPCFQSYLDWKQNMLHWVLLQKTCLDLSPHKRDCLFGFMFNYSQNKISKLKLSV